MSLKFYPEPSEEESRIRREVRNFLISEVAPRTIEDDELALFRKDYFTALAKKGLTAIHIPQEYGGRGLSNLVYCGCIEEIARVSPSLAVVVGVQNLVQGALLTFGTEEQRRSWLPKLTSGEWLGAFSLSEAGSGSDAASLRLAAQKGKGGYRISGTKNWCSSGSVADLILVMARTSEDKKKGISAFIVFKNTPGFRPGKQEKKLGLRASPLSELIFEDCFLTSSQRLGREGEGLRIALSQLDQGRISVASTSLGIAREAIERAWKFYQSQNRPIFAEGARSLLSDHYAHLQALKGVILEAARMRDQKRSITLLASQAKLLGSDFAMRVSSDVVELMMEQGYCREFEVERMMRDAKALQIVEGTNQIQRVILAREMDMMMERDDEF